MTRVLTAEGDRDAWVRATLNDATERVSGRIAEVLSSERVSLPKVPQSIVSKAAKSVVFSRERSVVELAKACGLLIALGNGDSAVAIANELATIPLIRDGRFEHIRRILQSARWWAFREARVDESERLRRAADRPEGYRPLYMDDDERPMFALPLDDPEQRQLNGLDPTDGYVLPPREKPSAFLQDLDTLAMIWGYGGSSVWPLSRLEAERARLEAGLVALPGMSPGA